MHPFNVVESKVTGYFEFCTGLQWKRLSHVGMTYQDLEDRNNKPIVGSLVFGNLSFFKYARNPADNMHYLITNNKAGEVRNQTYSISGTGISRVKIGIMPCKDHKQPKVIPANTMITALFYG